MMSAKVMSMAESIPATPMTPSAPAIQPGETKVKSQPVGSSNSAGTLSRTALASPATLFVGRGASDRSPAMTQGKEIQEKERFVFIIIRVSLPEVWGFDE
jgi:hypothetical protein